MVPAGRDLQHTAESHPNPAAADAIAFQESRKARPNAAGTASDRASHEMSVMQGRLLPDVLGRRNLDESDDFIQGFSPAVLSSRIGAPLHEDR